MQGDPSVRGEPLYTTPPPEGLPGVPEGADPRGGDHELLEEEGYEMNVYEPCPCPFSKFAVREEPASHLENCLVVCCSRWTTT